MAAFTIFFCGTGSNSYDFANTHYYQGELISTLARNHAGQEFVDWIIVDGPGSGNIQEAEKWVPAGNYSEIRGALQGKGWEENVKHAIAVLVGTNYEERTAHTRAEVGILRAAGVGVDTVERTGIARAVLGPTKTVNYDLHARISPQALQQRKIQIMRKGKPIDVVNVIGWSRGGVTCHMFANALAETEGWSHVPVNIFACDPVPGAGSFDKSRITVGANVRSYVAIYAADERSRGFSPVLPLLASNTQFFITTMPGRHATLVGNAAIDGGGGVNTLFGPGKVTRDLAERFLRLWGSQFQHTLDLTEFQILAYYEEMLAESKAYRAMRDVSYTGFTQGDRAVGMGDGTWRTFGTSAVLSSETVFANAHHRWVFERNFPQLYAALFGNEKLTAQQVEADFRRIAFQYPSLHERLKQIPVQLR